MLAVERVVGDPGSQRFDLSEEDVILGCWASIWGEVDS